MSESMLVASRWTTLVLGLAAASCGPPWQVLKQANPNPMLGKGEFVVVPIDFTNLQVGDTTEAQWQADKDADQRQSWVGDKEAMNAEFAKSLMSVGAEEGVRVATPPATAPFVVHPKIPFIEPGFFTAFVNKASEVHMLVAITTPDGQALDEIALEHSTPSSLTNPGSGHRLRDDAEALGAYTGEYLGTRVKGIVE
jgi:hypothetical protein